MKTIKSFMNYAFVEGYTTSIKHQSRDFKVENPSEIYLMGCSFCMIKSLSKTRS
jgi:hypothetical protein